MAACGAARESTLVTRSKVYKKPKTLETMKVRLCLMCREAFESSWSGDRVCRKCKNTSTWRSGSARDIVTVE